MRIRYALPRIIQLIWKKRPDVVFSTLGHLNLALAICRFFLPNGTKYIARETTIVSYGIKEYKSSKIWAWAYANYYKNLDRLICQSRAMRNDLINNFDLKNNKISVINNPCDIKNIRTLSIVPIDKTQLPECWHQKETVKLVAAGRLVDVKGFDILIEAISIWANPLSHLIILGEGPLIDSLRKQAQTLGVLKHITFAGFQRNPYPFFAQADAFILSSRYEGFPNVVIEALACGTPVIATPAPGGVKEILDGVRGCQIAETLDANGLAQAFTKFERNIKPNETCVDAYRLDYILNLYEKELLEPNLKLI